MIWFTDPSKNALKKSPLPVPHLKKKKKHNKAVQSKRLLLNLNKINEIWVFYNQQINKVTPHFTFMRRAQNADTHAHKQHRCPKTVSYTHLTLPTRRTV